MELWNLIKFPFRESCNLENKYYLCRGQLQKSINFNIKENGKSRKTFNFEPV